jgi:uncharacterized membrane protein
MSSLLPIGRSLFALALIGLGAEHFIFGAFVTGRAPAWPEPLAGGQAWAYVSGAFFIAIGGATLVGRHVRSAAFFAAGVIAAWALVRHLPALASEAFLSGAWTRAGKALTFTGGALALAAASPHFSRVRQTAAVAPAPRDGALIVLARTCLGTFLLISGVQHFLFTVLAASLIPRWFPGDHVLLVQAAGVALVAGGIGLFVPSVARLAATLSGLMVFSWFWIVHLPRTFVSVSDAIALFEALAVAGVAWMIAGHPATASTRRR